MEFKRITRLKIDGLIIRNFNHLTQFVNALQNIDSEPYHDKVPETPQDFEFMRREAVYQSPNRLNVKQFDSRHPGPGCLSYHVEF